MATLASVRGHERLETLVKIEYTDIESPLGELRLVANDGELAGVYLPGQTTAPDSTADWTRTRAPFGDASAQLGQYFAGRRTSFDLRLAPQGTEFQRRVWAALLEIPYGTTTTYRELAERIGSPSAARAVGRANGANPIGIVVPCHRVIGAAGALTGYAGGIAAKRWLLELEGRSAGQLRLGVDGPVAGGLPG